MTQVHYELIVGCIRSGCAAFANDLINALNEVIAQANKNNTKDKNTKDDNKLDKKEKV